MGVSLLLFHNQGKGKPIGNFPKLNGVHTGLDDSPMLVDSNGNFKINFIGGTIYNDTDASSGTITNVTATTVIATLAGGTDDDWDTNDVYRIIL